MTMQPVVRPDSPESGATSFTASVVSLMRALLASRDPGVDASPRMPQARLGDQVTGAYETVHSPHIRVDI